MKANELMLGDWVLYPNKTPQQIFGIAPEITADGATEDGFFNECEWYPLKDAKPIPITPEILEKNGFRETDVVVIGIRKMRWESEDGRTEITIWMDDTMPMEIRKNIYYEDEVCYVLPFVWAVHQLQHSLRLCGIEKEIEL